MKGGFNVQYQSIEFLTQWTLWVLAITPFAAGAMCTYQATRKSLTSDDETIKDCNNKMRNTVKGAIIIMTISGLIEIFKQFYL